MCYWKTGQKRNYALNYALSYALVQALAEQGYQAYYKWEIC